MKKIAVFGKPGSGKSTLSKALALATGIQLHQLDSIVYKKMGSWESAVHSMKHMSVSYRLEIGSLMGSDQ